MFYLIDVTLCTHTFTESKVLVNLARPILVHGLAYLRHDYTSLEVEPQELVTCHEAFLYNADADVMMMASLAHCSY